ncbi:MAG: GNAT family N-acetyltransferase [Anaerohalosphaeraceae bacterium]
MKQQKATITADRIRLRPMTEADLPLKVKWYNDPDIRKTLIVDEQFELDRTLEWYRAVKDSKKRLDLVIETETGKSIGQIGLVNIDRTHKTAEKVIVIGDKVYWGKGVMLEAESLLIDYAFSKMHLGKIWAQARTNNIASMITMKKLGFQIKETLPAHTVISGRPVDVFHVVLDREDFKLLATG